MRRTDEKKIYQEKMNDLPFRVYAVKTNGLCTKPKTKTKIE